MSTMSIPKNPSGSADFDRLLNQWMEAAPNPPSQIQEFKRLVLLRQSIEDAVAQSPISTSDLVRLKDADNAFRSATDSCTDPSSQTPWWHQRRPR